jgi:hypothetical protein
VAVFPDSRIIRANCGHLAWLSPQSESLLQTAYTCCQDCGWEILTDPDPRAPKATVPGAMKAIEARFSQREVNRTRAFMRSFGIQDADE